MKDSLFTIAHQCLSENRNTFDCVSSSIIGVLGFIMFILNLIICCRLLKKFHNVVAYLPIYIIASVQCLIIVTLSLITDSFEVNKLLYLATTAFCYYFLAIFMLQDLAIDPDSLRLKIGLVIATLLFIFSLTWNIISMAYFKCGDGYTAEYVIHVVIIVIFQVWLWRVGFDLIQTKIDKSYKSQNSNQFLYKEDDGYICQIKKSIRNLILSFVINTCVFYSMMAIWNEVFSDYYICVEETVFYPITDAAQIFTIIKGFSILAYSGIINWFFYASRHIHFKYKPGFDIKQLSAPDQNDMAINPLEYPNEPDYSHVNWKNKKMKNSNIPTCLVSDLQIPMIDSNREVRDSTAGDINICF